MREGEEFRRAQASAELLAIMGVALIYILFFAIFLSGRALDAQQQREINDAQLSVRALAQAADLVQSQGAGARQEVLVVIPPSTNFSLDRTFVGRPQGSDGPSNTIGIGAAGTTVTAQSAANLAGLLPNSTGTHLVNVTSRGTFVSIGQDPLFASPQRVHLSFGRGQTEIAYVNFTTSIDQPVQVNLTSSWEGRNMSLSVSPSSFVVYNGTATVQLSFTSGTYGSGLYSGSLSVSASSLGTPVFQLAFTVPISARVQEN